MIHHLRRRLSEFITTVKTPSDILKVVSKASEFTEEISSDNAKDLFDFNSKPGKIMRQPSHIVHPGTSPSPSTLYNQKAALILIIPVEFIPNEVFNWGQKLIPFLDSYEQIISSGLMMRLAKSSIILNQAGTILETFAWIIGRHEWIICPYLYLSASSKIPIDFDIKKLTQFSRVDCMTFYYAGINYLMLRLYEKALISFLHSLEILNFSDFSKNVSSHLFLTCFLLHFEEEQARLLIHSKNEIDEDVLNLFSYSIDSIESLPFSNIGELLITEINEELKRRKLYKISQTALRIPLDLLLHKIGIETDEEIFENLSNLQDEGKIKYKNLNGIIRFYQPDMKKQIEEQNETISKILEIVNNFNIEYFLSNKSTKPTLTNIKKAISEMC
ncbi:hypothetical protein TRFO_41284 [Tritrichomonas foetus]|uniref:PCI domain-containing protein n=1 Tax=Tritrichomonas foetus TaxID=1144522 RepID=A0A1J4L591_9EUKA|nr:hypothetical protein TRFO_41284 [Tritrichomonas foetus]|eukprot:OHT17101.1 hypothetical protein TRFO_41284 [Tritrichomonas foetus]